MTNRKMTPFEVLRSWVRGDLDEYSIVLDGFVRLPKKFINENSIHMGPDFNFKTVHYVGCMSDEAQWRVTDELLLFLRAAITSNHEFKIEWGEEENVINVIGKLKGEHMYAHIKYDGIRDCFICAYHPSTYSEYDSGEPSWWK